MSSGVLAPIHSAARATSGARISGPGKLGGGNEHARTVKSTCNEAFSQPSASRAAVSTLRNLLNGVSLSQCPCHVSLLSGHLGHARESSQSVHARREHEVLTRAGSLAEEEEAVASGQGRLCHPCPFRPWPSRLWRRPWSSGACCCEQNTVARRQAYRMKRSRRTCRTCARVARVASSYCHYSPGSSRVFARVC